MLSLAPFLCHLGLTGRAGWHCLRAVCFLMGEGMLGSGPASERLAQQASPPHLVLVWCCGHRSVCPASLGA